MWHRLTKSQCNLLIADKHKAAASGVFEMNSILKSWFISVCNNKMATFLPFSAEFVGEELVGKQNISSLLFYSSALALRLWTHVERCRLTGRTKVDVKAQSQSKLYNRAESLLGSHTGETGRRLEGERMGREGGNLERKDMPLCLFTLLTVHAAYELLGDLQNKALAIKRQTSPTFVFICGAKNKNHKHVEYVTLLSVAWRQRATAAVQPFYLRHCTGNI